MTSTDTETTLCTTAEPPATTGQGQEAIAMHQLVKAGYSTLEEVDAASDWLLLGVQGIGPVRLAAVRTLTRPNWQPPSRQAIKDMIWFLSSLRFALRVWSCEQLAALLQAPKSVSKDGLPIEMRLVLDGYLLAARSAQRHCCAESLVRLVLEAGSRRVDCTTPDAPSLANGHPSDEGSRARRPLPALEARSGEATNEGPPSDNGHFAFPRHERLEIVRRYRAAREAGKVRSKHGWAEASYQISGKTLLAYEREFAETEP